MNRSARNSLTRREICVSLQCTQEEMGGPTTQALPRLYFLQKICTYFPLGFPNICTDFQSFYFDREDVALKGFSKYFRKASDEEREHAMKLMKFQNARGGRIVLQNVQVIKI